MEGWFSESQGQTIDLKKKKRKRVVNNTPRMEFYEEELENENPEENPFLVDIPNFRDLIYKQKLENLSTVIYF